jgi:hypothetical protein
MAVLIERQHSLGRLRQRAFSKHRSYSACGIDPDQPEYSIGRRVRRSVGFWGALSSAGMTEMGANRNVSW